MKQVFNRLQNKLKAVQLHRKLLGLTLMCAPLTTQAQFGYFNDAQRFGQNRPAGTARNMAMGGVGQAIGADYSSATINPAGLGMFRRGQISISPGYSFHNGVTSYQPDQNDRTQTADSKPNLQVGHLGLVFASGDPERSSDKFKGGSFAIGLTRINDFNSQTSFQGQFNLPFYNNQPGGNGLRDHFAYLGNIGGVDPNIIDASRRPTLSPFEQSIRNAYSIFMLDTVGGRGGWSTFIPLADYQQNMRTTTSGNHLEWNISAGGNYNDRIYFGAAVGFQTFFYEEVRQYSETITDVYLNQSNPTFADTTFKRSTFNLKDRTSISGSGFNLKLGVQIRLSDAVRVGASLQTPTTLNLTQDFSSRLSAEYAPGARMTVFGQSFNLPASPFREYNIPPISYTLVNPWRFGGGAAFFIGKSGFITADAEWQNFTDARLSANDFSMNADNDEIRLRFSNTLTIKIGGEYRVDRLRLRGGAAFMGNPIRNTDGPWPIINQGFRQYSAGLGYVWDDFFLDFSIQRNDWQSRQRAHTFTPNASTDNTQWILGFGVGAFF